jgi:hypothetical protein
MDSSPLPADEALALSHVRRVKGFYVHLAQFCVVMTGLTAVNVALYPRYLWVIWPASIWGVALLFHGLRAFDMIPFLNGDWERRQVERYLGRKL